MRWWKKGRNKPVLFCRDMKHILGTFVREKRRVQNAVRHAVLTTVCVVITAGSQCGRMRHKENAWAPSFSLGAISIIVSSSCLMRSSQKCLNIFLMTSFYEQNNILSNLPRPVPAHSVPKSTTFPKHKNRKGCGCGLLCVVLSACCFPWSSLFTAATTWNMIHQRRKIPAWYSITKKTRL